MSRVRMKTIRLEHKHGALFDYSVRGKEVDHIKVSQAERSIVYVTVVFADRTEWSISIESFSLPTARVSLLSPSKRTPLQKADRCFYRIIQTAIPSTTRFSNRRNSENLGRGLGNEVTERSRDATVQRGISPLLRCPGSPASHRKGLES